MSIWSPEDTVEDETAVPSEGMGGIGVLSFNVWPSYIALVSNDENPHTLGPERRCQIWWRTVCADCGRPVPCGDELAGWTPTARPKIWGAAGGPNSQNSQGIWVPAGKYHYFAFYHTPTGESGTMQYLPHEHIQLRDGYVVVDPIENNDPAAQALEGIAR